MTFVLVVVSGLMVSSQPQRMHTQEFFSLERCERVAKAIKDSYRLNDKNILVICEKK